MYESVKEELPCHIQEIILGVSNKLFIVSEILENKDTFNRTHEMIYDYLKQGFEHEALRKCPVHFKFFDRDGEIIHTLQIRHFLTNLIFWEPIMRLKAVEHIDSSYIIDPTQLTSDLIKSYIDDKIVIPFRRHVNNVKLNKALHDLIFNLSRISTDFNILLGLSINMETFIDVANKNPRFNEIIRTKIPDGMQPKDIENMLDGLMNEQISILCQEDNFLKPILLSGTGIKHKQLSEFAINGGLKPDLDGNTIPTPINSNFIVGGLNNITNYYIDSLGGRKSVIMNKTVMGRSGHFARKVMLLVSGIKLSHEEDCGTVHSVEFEIKTKRHLEKLIDRYYRLPNSREYKVLTGKEKDLIGKKILVRSPAKCASKNGVCNKCYGELYYTNKNISIGGYAGAKITEPVSQNILSSKHLLTTTSEKIEFNEDFYKFFDISANEIILNANNEDFEPSEYSLVLIGDNIKTINEFDISDFNSYVEIFHVKNKKTGEIIEMKEKDMKELYIAPEIVEMLNLDRQKEVYELDLSKIEDDTRIFVVEIENNELTRPLYNIMYLLDRADHFGATTIDDMCQKMLDLMIESKIKANSVHGEVLIRPLIRSSQDVLDIPNFTKYSDDAAYQILTVENALIKHPSVLVSLSFQDLGRQLGNPLTFKKKAPSFIDPFFKERP